MLSGLGISRLYSGVITSGLENQDILIDISVDNYFYDFSDGYNPTNVWDENYVLVMHMGRIWMILQVQVTIAHQIVESVLFNLPLEKAVFSK